MGPYKIFDPTCLFSKGLMTIEEYEALHNTVKMKNYSAAKSVLDHILDSNEVSFGAQKMYLWISPMTTPRWIKDRRRIIKKTSVLGFLRLSHICFMFKHNMNLSSMGKPKDATTPSKYLKDHVIPKILNSPDPISYVGKWGSKYRDFISLYVSHKLGWI